MTSDPLSQRWTRIIALRKKQRSLSRSSFGHVSKGLVSLCMFSLTLLPFVPAPGYAADRTVKVGVYENAPKVFTTDPGRPAGIFIEIIEHIAEAEGWDLTYVPGTWSEGLERLDKGELDLMPDVAYTTERERLYAFHKVPVLTGWSQVYAPKGSGIQTILDLNGKRVGGLEQTIQLETFRRLTASFDLRIELVPLPDYRTEFEMLAAGKLDAGLTNRLYGLMHARKYGLEDTPIMFDPAPFFFAAPKQAPRDLLDSIDRRLERMKKDPRSAYYAAMKRWTSEEVELRLPPWMRYAGVAAAVALLTSLGASIVLKRQVDARTRELQQEMRERTNAMEEARLSAELVRFLTKHANDFILLLDEDFRFLEVNERVVDYYGYTREELMGRPVTDLRADETRDEFSAQVGQATASGMAIYETLHKRKDGSVFPVEVSLRAVDDSGTRLYQAVIRDITERKKTEAELERHRLHLEELVRERTSSFEEANAKLQAALGDLAVAKDRAEAADRLKSAFLATMSHELRTPLNSIIGFTGILRQGLAGPLNDEQKKQMDMVQTSADHLLALINDVLDISKIEAGQLQVVRAPFAVEDSVLKIVQAVRPLAEKKGLTLSADVDGTVGTITSDQRRVEQVLLNLLSNAIKYTDRGHVRVECGLGDGFLRTVVTDSGIGIAADELPKLFQPFHQVESGLTRRYEGTGLGLSICKRLVELLGGTIHAESEPGRGSRFSFLLPADRGAA